MKLRLNKSNIPEQLLIIELIVATAIECFLMLNITAISSLLLATNYILVFLLFFFILRLKSLFDARLIVPLFVIIAFSFVALFITSQDISFSYSRKWIMFACTMILFFCVSIMEISKAVIKTWFCCSIVLAVVFFYMYLSGNLYLSAGCITFNLENPNFTGLCITCVFFSIYCLLFFVQKVAWKCVFIIMLAMLFVLVLLTQSRSCILAIMAFILLSIFSRPKHYKWASLTFILLPVFISELYTQLVNVPWFTKVFGFMISEGKALTSRVTIWEKAAEIIMGNPIIGNYFKVTEGTGEGQMHNMGFDIMASFGIPVFVATAVLLYFVLCEVGKHITVKYQKVALAGFYSLLLISVFEAGLFSGSKGMYVIAAGLLMLTKYQKENIDETT